jgi:hypothetical protein
MTTILLVTGSRALCDTPEAEAWAKEELEDHIVGLPTSSLLVTGDARGPDTWALRYADRHYVLWHKYALDGYVYWPGGRLREWHSQWTLPKWESDAWHKFPLVRNRAMVERVGQRPEEYDRSRCLALVAPWAKTRGTGFTAGLCRKASIPVTELMCPAEYAPRRP